MREIPLHLFIGNSACNLRSGIYLRFIVTFIIQTPLNNGAFENLYFSAFKLHITMDCARNNNISGPYMQALVNRSTILTSPPASLASPPMDVPDETLIVPRLRKGHHQ